MKKIILTAALAASLSIPARASLVACWNLEEGSGTSTTELTGSTVSDAFGAGVTWNTTSTAGVASMASLDFTGATTARFGVNENAQDVGVGGTNAKTIVAWINTSAASSGTTRYFWGWSPSNGMTNGGDLRFGVQNGGLRFEVTGGAATNTASLVNDGNWHMVAAVIDAGDTISTIQFYLDGSLIAATGNTSQSINTIATGAGTASNPNEFFIGSNGNGTANNWIGGIDDVRIYDTALTGVELDGIRTAMATAVPEPSSASLILGAAGLCLLARRRRRS